MKTKQQKLTKEQQRMENNYKASNTSNARPKNNLNLYV